MIGAKANHAPHTQRMLASTSAISLQPLTPCARGHIRQLQTSARKVNVRRLTVECFPQSGDSLPYSTSIPAEMCSDCGGPWQGKCEWKHYTPGFLAFAGPGEHCGFSYPVCPASEGKNCFCGQAANNVKEGWCDNGAGMQTFCPNALNHGNGRSQECSWSGWTVSPQVSGGATASCAAWGLETSSGR